MYLNRIAPSFGRAVSAADALTRNQTSFLVRPPGSRNRFRRTASVAAVATLLCFTPGTMFAQHGNYRHGSSGKVSKVTCSSGSLTGAGTDACTVTLTSAAGNGGMTVSLASSSSAVKVPTSVAVVSGATTAGFAATASVVSSAQTATLTASGNGNSAAYSLQLKPATTIPTGTAALTLGSTSVAFGSVSLNTPSTQTVKLTSSGTASLTISSAPIKGTGFTMSGVTTPLTLTPGQTATLDLQFDPTAAGADTGTVTIASNAASGGTATIGLSGTGTSAAGYQVQLTWDAPSSSSDPVAGYKVYRAASGGTSYQLLNTSVQQPTTYIDTTVLAGTSYTYEVMSVDASGVQSVPSNVYAAAIP
jgi:hypothetical protein